MYLENYYIFTLLYIIMKKIIIIGLIALFSIGLTSCGTSEAPLTEAQQAEKYGMSVEEFKEQKDAAARMNMTIEDHLKMGHGWEAMDHGDMDMSDDSHMIEDDNDMSGMHTMEDGTKMGNDEAMSWDSTHTMEDGRVMTDQEMHMETMHEGEDIEEHGSDKHWDHE